MCMHAGAELDSPHCRGQLGSENYSCGPGTIYIQSTSEYVCAIFK